jgi:hypothetical protein
VKRNFGKGVFTPMWQQAKIIKAVHDKAVNKLVWVDGNRRKSCSFIKVNNQSRCKHKKTDPRTEKGLIHLNVEGDIGAWIHLVKIKMLPVFSDVIPIIKREDYRQYLLS